MDWLAIIEKVGFPIGATFALAAFIFFFAKKIFEENKEREKSYIETITRCNDLLREFQATNAKFVEQLEIMQASVLSIKDDVDDIKNVLNINNRKTD